MSYGIYGQGRPTYRPPLQHANPGPVTTEQRAALAALLEQLAHDVRSGTATTAGVSVQPAQRQDRTSRLSPPEPGKTVYVGVTVDSPAVDAAREVQRDIHDTRFGSKEERDG